MFRNNMTFLNKELDKQIKDLKNNPIKEEGGVALQCQTK